ncbi:hypothetical protein HJC23_004432 [Cyclotella cryptica]|uniref:Uncharacterized protein n=1 Tax=Cyclotella cryptica TaxID=29204 RepID=A0ABD3QGQ1_9STRA|eukprot:CCRYP_006053-RA/>CCRYP_006053-RA protein AED:0.41 eAED:0.41 QI:0/-1/0/1/-1/1/1/0/339
MPNTSSHPPSTIYPTQLLFLQDGISVTATILTPDATTGGTNTSNAIDPDIEHNGIIVTLYLHRHAEKNVINPTMIQLLNEALDVIESHDLLANTNNKSLILTGLSPPTRTTTTESTTAPSSPTPHGKFFSNGLDLEWMLQSSSSSSASETPSMIQNYNSQILARILTLPFRTVAAIHGHCIGAGLFLALACDYRIMRTERGYIQWPEARLGMRLTKGFAELSKAKIVAWRQYSDGVRGDVTTTTTMRLDRNVLREGIFTAKKYTPSEAFECGIVDSLCSVEELYQHAFQWAVDGLPESGGMKLEYFDPKAYSMMKMEMYTDAYRALKFGSVEDLPYSRI